jgi:glutaredoxin-related protein
MDLPYKLNNKLIGLNGKFVGHSNTLPPITGITITTTKIGTFSTTLKGTGDVVIDWGDNSARETKTLNTGGLSVSHTYTSGTKTLTISNPTIITSIVSSNQNITVCDIPLECTNITSLDLKQNQLTSFTTNPLWNPTYIYLDSNLLTSFTAYSGWTNLIQLYLNNNKIGTFSTYSTWTSLGILHLYNNQLSGFTAYSNWTSISSLYLGQNYLTEFTAYSNWTNLYILNLANTQITTFTAYSTWLSMYYFSIQNAAVSSATDINNILVALDATNMNTGDFIFMNGGTNATPTGAGATAKGNLITKGVSVNTN